MRIDKFLAHTGFGSRKDVKALVRRGRVAVGGVAVQRPEHHIDPNADEIRVDGAVVTYTKYVYVMMNKPAGAVSATWDEDDETVSDLAAEATGIDGLFPVGRLDKDATGLIILTNDGIFAHRATSPKKNVAKVYQVEVEGLLGDADAEAFLARITLEDGYHCRPATLALIESGPISRALVTLTEGKYHQVKRMFGARGKRVLSLKRISFANITLPTDLPEGSVRALNDEEMAIIAPLMAEK